MLDIGISMHLLLDAMLDLAIALPRPSPTVIVGETHCRVAACNTCRSVYGLSVPLETGSLSVLPASFP